MITQKSPAPVSRKGGIATLVAFVPHPTHPPLGMCVCVEGGGAVKESRSYSCVKNTVKTVLCLNIAHIANPALHMAVARFCSQKINNRAIQSDPCVFFLTAEGTKPGSAAAESLKLLKMAGWVRLKTVDARHILQRMTGLSDPGKLFD